MEASTLSLLAGSAPRWQPTLSSEVPATANMGLESLLRFSDAMRENGWRLIEIDIRDQRLRHLPRSILNEWEAKLMEVSPKNRFAEYVSIADDFPFLVSSIRLRRDHQTLTVRRDGSIELLGNNEPQKSVSDDIRHALVELGAA